MEIEMILEEASVNVDEKVGSCREPAALED